MRRNLGPPPRLVLGRAIELAAHEHYCWAAIRPTGSPSSELLPERLTPPHALSVLRWETTVGARRSSARGPGSPGEALLPAEPTRREATERPAQPPRACGRSIARPPPHSNRRSPSREHAPSGIPLRPSAGKSWAGSGP